MKTSLSKNQYKKGIYLILFLGILICIWDLGSTGLVDETPPLFAAASRAMSETGNWLTPRVNGLNRFDKPPLIYWLMGIFYSLPKNNLWDPLGTWSARLPSALSTVAVMLVLGDTLMKWPSQFIVFPRRTAVVGAIAFAISPLVIIWSRIAVSDALLCSTLGISLILGWRSYANNKNKTWWLSWIILGLAVLVKGPVALVLAAMTYIIFGCIQRDCITLFKRIRPLKGVFITLIVSIPWYIAELFTEGKPFWDSFFGYHNFQRLTSVVNSHSQPWWFFVMMLLIASLPFTPFLITSIGQFFYTAFNFNSSYLIRPSQSLLTFSGSWMLSVFLLFTFAATKLPSYWMPATPAAAIMIALAANDTRNNKYKSASYIFLFLSMLSLAVILSLPGLWIFLIEDPEMPNLSYELLESGLYLRAAICFYITAFITLYFIFKPKVRSLFFIQVPLILFQFFVMLPLWKLSDTLRQEPLRKVSQELLVQQNNNEPIAMVGIRKPSIHFYTNKIILYESNDVVALVNLSDRLRLEVREKWLDSKTILPSESDTLLLIIDNKTSSYEHWQELKPEIIGNFGIYNIWRLKTKDLEDRAISLKLKGVLPDWQEHKDERF
ncbi:ArnT family glycosyltransferase [Prochlorococcus marinus]|uniref:ArnT family glycosyltransferase n=1 Tax=Prochlorococcus marinus TaxID=1219 RepID=UPI00055B5A69|nr:glycosyltransferase family 39 protein [Prochlorococcus marinus]